MIALPRNLLTAVCATAFAAGPALAQNMVKISGLYELSGAGASAGTMFKNGVEGGEATAITTQRNAYIFRTSVTQATAMPKVARYIAGNLKATTVAVIFDVDFDDKGDLDRESFIVEVKGGKQEVKEVLPPLSAKK